MIVNRTTYRIAIIALFIFVNILILYGVGQILSYLNTGADRSSMLHLTIKNKDKYLPKVIWHDTINPGRPIEKQTLKAIQSDYLSAWYVRNIAYKTNASFGIDDYYTQSARKNIEAHILDQKAKKINIESTTLNHNLHLDFYSADGQLAIITDRNSYEYQRIYQKKQLITETKNESSYRVMLLLEDGFWKIRHLVKIKNIPQPLPSGSKPLTKVKNTQIYIQNKPFQIKGINYYPQATPWDFFGRDFNRDVISKDFNKIKKLGLNTIRIFVPYNDFGKEAIPAQKLEKLKQVLDNATKKNLKVIVTLFDFYGNYSVQDWTLTHRHVAQIVTAFKNHQAILAWDVKNEPNLDFESRGKTNVLAWLREIIHQIKSYDPNHLVTIGWSNLESAHLLEKSVDFVSFHYYENSTNFENEYQKIRSLTLKPLVLQEFGLSSDRSVWNPLGASKKSQAAFYKDFGNILQKHKIHNLSWTLYDFKKIPTAVVGKLPWRKHKQKHFGFIDKNGKPKPAIQFIRN